MRGVSEHVQGFLPHKWGWGWGALHFLFRFFPLESENGKMTAWKRKIPLTQMPFMSLRLGAKTVHPFSLNSVDFVDGRGGEVTLVGRGQGTERVERENASLRKWSRDSSRQLARGDTGL